MTMPGMFAMVARRQMEEHGATIEDFAQVSVKNHHHGCLNPKAQYKKEFTIEEVLNSRMIVIRLRCLCAARILMVRQRPFFARWT